MFCFFVCLDLQSQKKGLDLGFGYFCRLFQFFKCGALNWQAGDAEFGVLFEKPVLFV